MAAAAMAIYTALTAIVLGANGGLYRLVGWMSLCTLLLAARFGYSRWARRHLDVELPQLRRQDRVFRLISTLSQVSVGAGIWVVDVTGTSTTAYIITLFIALYGVGAIVNLAHDFATVKYTLPLLLIQPIVYWLAHGSDGLIIALVLAGLGFMMLSLAGNSHRNFNETIRVRYEKDQLLRQLATEQRATAAALEAAEAANRSKSFFMAAASHDLRQPLYAVSILHDALSLHELGPEPARLLAQQGVAIKATASLFDNLLDLSKFESGVVKPNVGRVALAELLGELEAEFAPQCAARGIRLTVARGLPDVHSDYELLGRLLRNLISNALRYTEQGGIDIRFAAAPGELTLAIADTGIGIAAADQERVFGAFVQLNNPQRAREGGTGLGLAIVQHIARLLQHPIRLQSERGRGTTVQVTLPALDPAPAGTAAPAAPQPAVVPLGGRTAWIVEDDPLVRSAVAEYLAERGCRCYVAPTHAELRLQLPADSQPDFVILDDMLGDGESGLDIALRLAASLPVRRILLTTGNANPVRWQRLLDTGARVERKPVAAQTLDAWLAEAL